mgnify:CR=1 FL=1
MTLVPYMVLAAFGVIMVCRISPTIRREVVGMRKAGVDSRFIVTVVLCSLPAAMVGILAAFPFWAKHKFNWVRSQFRPDWLIVLEDSFVFCSARLNVALRVPKAWPLFRVRRSFLGPLDAAILTSFLEDEVKLSCEVYRVSLPKALVRRLDITTPPLPKGKHFWVEARRLLNNNHCCPKS